MREALSHNNCVCVRSVYVCAQSCPTLVAPGMVAHQAPLPMEFSRQEYWSGVPFPTPRDLPNTGIELASLAFPALVGGFFTSGATWEAHHHHESNRCHPLVCLLFPQRVFNSHSSIFRGKSSNSNFQIKFFIPLLNKSF